MNIPEQYSSVSEKHPPILEQQYLILFIWHQQIINDMINKAPPTTEHMIIMVLLYTYTK